MTPPKSKVPPHPFVADPQVPPDQKGRRACRVSGCRLMGEPGDAHHTLPDAPPEQEWVARRYEGDER